MIFSDDSLMMSLIERHEDEQELKDAVLKYCKDSNARETQLDKAQPVINVGELDLERTDTALEKIKRRRSNQIAKENGE